MLFSYIPLVTVKKPVLNMVHFSSFVTTLVIFFEECKVTILLR